MQFFCFLIKICLENFLGIDHMHENKTFFFVFWKGKLIQKFWDFFCKNNFRNISEKTEYFDIESISYSVNIQPDIMQN
jgi:hypothetical protein